MVIQEKKNGKARRTVDVSYLSKHGLNESQHTPSAPIIAKRVPHNKYKSALDCVDGYHVIGFTEEDRQPLPQNGANSTTGELPKDTYHQGTATAGTRTPSWKTVKDFKKIVDDIITWSDTVDVAFQSIFSILSHCNTNGLVFNSEKFRFARREVEFGGIKTPAK